MLSFWSLLILLLGQIKMSNQTEARVEDLLSKSKWNTNNSASTSTVSLRQFLPSTSSSVIEPAAPVDKEKLSSQLRDLQNSRKVLSVTMAPPFPSFKNIHEHSSGIPPSVFYFRRQQVLDQCNLSGRNYLHSAWERSFWKQWQPIR